MILKATKSDLVQIAKIHLKYFKQIGETKDSIKKYFESDISEFYVYKKNEKVLGYFITNNFEKTCYLNWFGIVESQDGVAQELIDYLIKISKKNSKKFIQLISRNRYRKAISFYLKNDFDIFGTYIGQDGDLMIQLRKKI